jgi:hypothetical protein
MAIETFENREVWQSSRTLARSIYAITERDSFARDFALRDQLRRAAISIMSHSRQLSAFIKYLDQHSQKKRTQRKVTVNG